MGRFREHFSDPIGEARDRLAALQLVFFDRTSLNLNQREIEGIISGFWDIQDILDELLQSHHADAAPEGPTARQPASDVEMQREMDLAAARSRAALAEYAAFYPDYQTKLRVEKDIALIKHLSRAADKLLEDDSTNEGADSELTSAVWTFIGQINDAAQRVEDAIEVKGNSKWGLPDEDEAPPEPRRRPAARPPSSAVNLTEEVPPDERRDPEPGDTAGRARA